MAPFLITSVHSAGAWVAPLLMVDAVVPDSFWDSISPGDITRPALETAALHYHEDIPSTASDHSGDLIEFLMGQCHRELVDTSDNTRFTPDGTHGPVHNQRRPSNGLR